MIDSQRVTRTTFAILPMFLRKHNLFIQVHHDSKCYVPYEIHSLSTTVDFKFGTLSLIADIKFDTLSASVDVKFDILSSTTINTHRAIHNTSPSKFAAIVCTSSIIWITFCTLANDFRYQMLPF